MEIPSTPHIDTLLLPVVLIFIKTLIMIYGKIQLQNKPMARITFLFL